MAKYIFGTLLIFATLMMCKPAQKSGQPDSLPNIVLIYMDDMGYGDVNAYGNMGFHTPNIDRLATEGMRFTNLYSSQPICTASRAGLLTGCYPNRIGLVSAIGPNSKTGISEKEMTMAEMLKAKGFATAIVGKWHLGDAQKFLPLQHGFDEYLGLPYSNDMWPLYYDGKPDARPRATKTLLPLIDGNNPVRFIKTLEDQDSLTAWYTERSVSFIRRNKNKPFFLYVAHTMPHVPLAVSGKFKGKSQRGLYGDVMMEVDWSVGKIMNALKENGLDKNTIVVFTSDNGPWLTFGNHGGSAGSLREGKLTTYEGGQKVPFIVRWPGVVAPNSVCGKLACNIDLLPTFAAITGAPLPTEKIDGVNILPLFKGDMHATPREDLYYYYYANSLEAVRDTAWKLVLPHKYASITNGIPGRDGLPGKIQMDSTGLALYDLRRDPGERYDVKEQHPDVVRRLQELAEQAREDLGDDLAGRPGKNRRAVGKL